MPATLSCGGWLACDAIKGKPQVMEAMACRAIRAEGAALIVRGRVMG